MKKRVKITLFALVTVVALAVIALCVLLAMDFRFSAESAIHSYWHKGTHIEADEYDFWLNDVNDENEKFVYGAGHTAVKQYGFLYKEVEEDSRKELIDQYGSYVGSLTRYEGKETDYYFIHWMQSVTGIVDGEYTQSMRYFTDTITVNDKDIKLLAHCFFELDEEMKTLVVKGEKITIVDEYEKPSVSVFAPEPDDTTLEFWITENVENVDFSQHNEIYGWMGAREFYGKGYSSVKDEDGNDVKPEHYVTYLITAYPDYADGGQFVTRIDITDPNVSVYGLTVNSSIEEYDAVFRKMGYVISVEERGVNTVFTATRAGITFELCIRPDELTPSLAIKAEVTNREGIVF